MSAAAATQVKAPWENWVYQTFDAYLHNEYNGGYVNYTNEFTKLPEGALGSWRWQERTNRPASLIITINWDAHSPKHHGDWSREAALAHMILHSEDGTSCSGADPQEWGAYERELDTRAMVRLGWTSWRSLTIWDEKLRKMVDIHPDEPHLGAHVAKNAPRRRRQTSALLTAPGRR